MIARIAAGAALGAVIGYERDLHRRPVGLRTHLLVALTSATFMVISSQFVFWQRYAPGEGVEVDASRIAASVVSGIGFLAGGAILRTGLSVQGLTTAAGLWLVTAIGMCAGAGMFVEGGVVTALGIVALTFLRRFEDKDVLHRRVSVELGDPPAGVAAVESDAVLAAVRGTGATVFEVDYERRLDEAARGLSLTLDVVLPERVAVASLVAAVEGVPGVRRIRVQQPG